MALWDIFRRTQPAPRRRALMDYLPGGKVPRVGGSGSGFVGALHDRLTADFKGSELSADAAIFQSLDSLRARSRQLYMSNPYASRFLQMVVSNVLGRDGIRLEARTRRAPGGELDLADNRLLEAAWARWSRAAECSVDGRSGFLDIQRVALMTLARDGEVLVRLHNAGAFGLQLELIEADRLLTRHNRDLGNGTQIRMGVEQDRHGRPIAYHITQRGTGDNPVVAYNLGQGGGAQAERVPAEEIVHLYIMERPGQSRGYPWMAQAMRSLHMTDQYREAELVHARVAASKMAFYTSPAGDGYTGDDIDGDGALVFEAEAGLIEQLPAGMELKTIDWNNPNADMGEFVKSCLRGVAAGLNVSYNSLANDLEGVNYSSIRAGVQDEREAYKSIQRHLMDHLLDPIYQAWLTAAMTAGAVPFPPRKRDKYEDVIWRPRGFSYVDPQKDQSAFERAVALGTMSRQEIAAAQGKDFGDVLAELAEEERRAYELGVNISPRQTMPIYPAMIDPEAQAKGDFGDNQEDQPDG
jgi:lambda family phage portal protein